MIMLPEDTIFTDPFTHETDTEVKWILIQIEVRRCVPTTLVVVLDYDRNAV